MTTSNEDLRQEEHVLNSPVSQQRVANFYSDYLDSRRQSGAVELVFEQAEALRKKPDWDDIYGIGFNLLIRKGPFVDGSNWAEYKAWDFALAVERNLLSKFDDLLRKHAEPMQAEPVKRTWSSIFSAADDLLFQPAFAGSNACIVVTGPLHANWLLDLTRQPDVVPAWDLPRDANRTWIHGTYRKALILHISESPASNVFVVNLPRFGTLTQHGSPQFEVIEIDDNRAQDLIKKQPELTEAPDPVRALKLKVLLRLYEGWSFDPMDVKSARYAPLVDSDGAITA